MTPVPDPDRTHGRSLRSGFLRSAAEGPNHAALVVGDRTYSYQELEDRARRWAAAVVEWLERPAQRVGVFAHRSEVGYTGTLAALFSGAAFVPLNRTFPLERTRSMIQQADLDAVIVDAQSARQLADILTGLERSPLILLPEQEGAPDPALTAPTLCAGELRSFPPLDPLPPVLPDEIAYLLFTSGSTGVPKGVPVAHRNVAHFIDVMVGRYAFSPEDRFSQTFDQTFDLSVFDLFVAWECGARLCAMQPLDLLAPARFARKHELTVWFSVPSIPALMLKKNLLKPRAFPTLRWSLFCGESLPRATAQAWQAAAPESVVENLYGPTELTIACFVHHWDPHDSPELCVNDVVPIGRPFPGLGALLVDESLGPVAAGEPGELCVCGPQTVPAYWRDVDKTADRFVALESVGLEALRFYRTGDRVRRLAGGEYVYLGRTDHQIKVLGHRVELGEIEAALRRDERVVQAIAMGWPVHAGSAEGIVAFVSGAAVDAERLKTASAAVLPDYMTPDRIDVLEEMPLNANGKVDRNALRRRLEDSAPA